MLIHDIDLDIYISTNKISFKSGNKFLGVHLHSKLYFHDHINQIYIKESSSIDINYAQN